MVPNGALGGEAVLASMERGINVISVQNESALNVFNSHINYSNFIEVKNYYEAAGLLLALREGINHKSIQRPLTPFIKSRIN